MKAGAKPELNRERDLDSVGTHYEKEWVIFRGTKPELAKVLKASSRYKPGLTWTKVVYLIKTSHKLPP